MNQSSDRIEGFGANPAGPAAIIILAIYLISWVVAALLGVVSCWPDMDLLLFNGHKIGDEVRFLFVSMAAGTLGSTMRTLSSFVWYVGNRSLIWSWLLYYAVEPLMGTAMGMFVYLAIRAGLLKASASADQLNLYTITVFAAVAGLWARYILAKLKNIAEERLGKSPAGRDTVGPPHGVDKSQQSTGGS